MKKENKLLIQILKVQKLYKENKDKQKNIAIGWRLSGGNID